MAKYCRYCGAPLAENAAFCRNCGKAVPKQETQKMEPVQPRFCRMCGKELRPGAKFCAGCGWEIGAPSVSERKEERPQKTTSVPGPRLIKAAIAAVLAVAVFVSFVYPGFVRTKLFGSNGVIHSAFSGGDETEEVLLQGNSKPFKLETPYGITISAEENALDKDREFKLEPVSEKKYNEINDVAEDVLDGPGFIMGAWELDAGLQDDEILPGYYDIDINLEEMGLDGSDFDSLKFYRIDDEGLWYEYPAGCNGNTVSIKANQNSILAALLVGITVKSVITTVVVTTAVGLEVQDVVLGQKGGAYFNPLTGSFDLYYKGKPVMEVMLDRNKILNELLDLNKEYLTQLAEKAQEEAFQQLKKEEGDLLSDFKDCKEMCAELKEWKKDPELQRAANRLSKKFLKKYNKLYEEKCENDPDYLRIKQNLSDVSEFHDEFELVDKVCEAAKRSWGWLSENVKLKMPTYKFRIEISSTDSGYGATITPNYGNPYMVVSVLHLGSGTALAYDRLLCTMCHEMFHAIQREYVSKYRRSYKFDEMTAQDLEEMAYEHFKAVEEDPITSSKEEILENLSDAYFFAIPLDEYSTSYPEGKLSGKDDATVSYPVAPFLTYLRKEKKKSYPVIMSKYKGLFGKRDVTTIIKEAFSLGSDEELTENYQKFAESYKETFLKEARKEKVNAIFSPLARLKASSGKAKVELLNKNYTTRVRRVSLETDNDSGAEYAVVLKHDDTFKDMMSDFVIMPLGMNADGDYTDFADGLFIKPKTFKDGEMVYLMEVDGGTAAATEGTFSNSYSGYTLYLLTKPESPKVSSVGSEISVTLPPFGDKPSNEVVDSYVITIRSGKTIVAQDRMGRKSISEPVTFDTNEFKIKGKKLTNEEMNDLSVVIQECVEGTFEEGEPCEGCFGPESDPVTLSNDDIFGTWEVESAMQGYENPLLDQYVGMMGDAANYLGSFGEGLNQYVEGYNGIQDEYAHAVTKGKMIIRPSGKDMVEAEMEFEGTPKQTYVGDYDKASMKLKLSPKDTMYTDSDGNTYDLADYGLAAEIDLEFYKDEGEKVMKLKGESAMDNQLVSYKVVLTGTKISNDV